MILRRTTAAALFSYTTVRNHSTTRSPQPFSQTKLRWRAKAIQQAQEALTDYLHSVRTMPFAFAEAIGKNSLVSLYNVLVVSKIEFSTPGLSKSLQKFFRYHPVNEFEFFYESIGIDVNEIDGFLPKSKFFLSEDLEAFNAACTLYNFGFPWHRLGMLYKEERLIFDKDPCELKEILSKLGDYGFSSSSLIGICLVFPHVLNGSNNGDALVNDLIRVIIDFDLDSDVENNVDAWIEVCRKIRMFYDLGCQKGEIGELMGNSKHIFVEYPEQILAEKIEYFCRFDVKKEEVGLLLLSRPEIFSIDIKIRVISVVGLLKHFGLGEKDLNFVSKNYPYVLGRNKLSNLPHVMRALNLNEWLFNRMKDGDHHLLGSYVIDCSDEDFDKEFADNLLVIQSSRLSVHTKSKLEFLHGIGYGENKLTVKVLKHIHGNTSVLRERFDCLIRNGIEFSKLCKMLSLSPKILNLHPECLEKKVKFLCQDIGSSLQDLDIFPSYLLFHLEKRIKPRYRFHLWLVEKGLCGREYSLSSLIATSEKSYIDRISRIHPAAPKKWLEIFSNPKYDGLLEVSDL